MYEYFDKHGKKLLAIVGSLLVLVFLLPAGFSGRGGGTSRFGKVDGQRIDPDDIDRTQNIFHSLGRLIAPAQGPDGQVSLAPLLQGRFFGKGLVDQFEHNPVLAYLLMNEAAQAGASISDSDLDRILAAPVQFSPGDGADLIPMDKLNPALKDEFRSELGRVLAMGAYFSRQQSVSFKISRPLIDDGVARQSQQIKARVAIFDSAKYAAQVPAPTDDEMKRQFDGFAASFPAVADDNPFGFGYRVVDRITPQWLAVPEADCAKAVEATQTPERWEESAIVYYTKNPGQFSTTPSATQPSSASPTTRPYAEARSDVIKAIREPLIEQKKKAVANRIIQMMQADYAKAAKTPTTQTAATGYGVAYGSFDYLQKLADDIQKQTGVRPTAVAPAGPLTLEDLVKQPGLGSTYIIDRTLSMPIKEGPLLLFESLAALHPNAVSGSSLQLGQPSVVLNGTDGVYVARVMAVDPSHAAKSLDEVKTQVDKDVRRTHAFQIAADAAQAALDAANKNGGLEKTGVAIQTSDWFSADSPTPAGLTGDHVANLVGPAFEQLRGVASPAQLPKRSLTKLRAVDQVAVIEVFDVKTSLNTRTAPEAAESAEQELFQALQTDPQTHQRLPFVQQWFDFDNVAKRVHYVADAPRDTQSKDNPSNPQNPANPANPLLPG